MRTHSLLARKTFARALAALLAITMVSPLWAAPGDITQVPAPTLGADAPKAKDIPDGDMSVSTQTGAFQYTYPIAVPPGRMGMQPSLALSYSSQGSNYGGVAMGWSLGIPEITLDTSDSLITRKILGGPLAQGQYVSTMAGGRPLVAVTEPALPDVAQTFRARNDSSWARYEKMETGAAFRWRVRTPDGNTHYFGESSRAPLTSDTWAPLTRTEDSFGNTMEYIWEGWQILQIRYTSNPAAGLSSFARVDFIMESADYCDGRPVGAQEDRKLGIIRGEQKLTKIRAVAFNLSTDEHTREISLIYSPDRASCTASHAPMRVLAGIQESAWGAVSPRVDLPPVTFEYNRFHHTFDSTGTPLNVQSLWPDENPYFPHNFGWGIRRQGASWPSVEGMLLDFDGDGLQDRIYVYADGNECMFNWSKNLGRSPSSGEITFSPQPNAQTLPRLPWAGAQRNSSVEWCSLSAQLTMKTNVNLPPPNGDPPCPSTTGTYLAYRWLDLTGDQLPDLVTAIHHDPRHFDPNAMGWFGAWPSCSDDPSCPAVSSSCIDQVTTCPSPESSCTLSESGVNACVGAAPQVACDYLTRQSSPGSYDDCIASCAGNEQCPQICANLDRIDPPNNGAGADCNYKKPHKRCERFPWMIYENKGGWFSPTPQIRYQPVPLESDAGDSSFGGGVLAAARHALLDIDGDGNLDAIVRGGYTEQSLTVEHNNLIWLVFPGDGDGNFLTDSDGGPRLWLVPDAAPISLSCSTPTGTVCSPLTTLYNAPIHENDHDSRGLSTVMDLNGDGAPDLLWKFATTQFEGAPFPPKPWEDVVDSDPMALYKGNGYGFEFRGSITQPEGSPLASSGVAYFSRSFVDAQAHLANHFMTTGLRQSKARFQDVDQDGRPDLIESSWNGTSWEYPSVFFNHGGQLLPGIALGAQTAEKWSQETQAMPTGFSSPREWGWQTKRDVIDLDGDGVPESWNCVGGACQYYRDPDPQPMHLMKRVQNGRGATIEVTYAASTDSSVVTQDAGTTQNGERQALPRTQWVVKSTSTSDLWDGPEDVSTTTYAYKHPTWKPDDEGDWGFRGFKEVTTTSPSGSKQVDSFGFDVDWSGRHTSTRVYSSDDLANPKSIAETIWTEKSLFGGAVRTYHVSDERRWTCSNGQNESACKANNSLVHTSYTYEALPTSGTPLVYYNDHRYVMQSGTYSVGDRHHWDTMVLHAGADYYRLRPQHARVSQKTQSTPPLETWASYKTTHYDADYKAPTAEEVFFERDTVPYENAVTAWTRDPATGVITTTQYPRNAGTNHFESYGYDSTKRFHTYVVNEAGHAVERKTEPGTGVVLIESGPSSASCGNGCTNWEKTWTDVDGLGRPIATWVNREVPGNPVWQKTQVSWTTYVDSVIAGARTKVVSETLIDYVNSFRSREEAQLDGYGRPEIVTVEAGGIDAVTTYDYDHRGHMVGVAVPDPSQHSTATVTYSYGFDSLGRPSSITRPLAAAGQPSGMTLSYDGLVHTQQEVAGSQGGPASKTVLVHDAFGRLAEVRETTQFSPEVVATTLYTYDARDAVTHIQNPDNVHTDLVHDMGGRRIRITRGGRTWSYAYNASGDMIAETTPYQAPTQAWQYTTTFGYDQLGRQTSRVVAPRSNTPSDRQLFGIYGNITLKYDTASPGTPTCTNGVGRLCTVTFPNNQWGQSVLRKSFAYDAEGNQASETRTFNIAGIGGTRATSATYGPGGKIASQKYADNTPGSANETQAFFEYDVRNLPWRARWRPSTGSDYYIEQHRNVAGNVLYRGTLFFAWYGYKDFRSEWTYDSLSRVTSQTVTRADWFTSEQLARQHLEYFGQDDPYRLQHSLGSAAPYDLTFDYDARHHLKTVREASTRFTADYQFTSSGRFLTANVQGASSPAPGADVVNRTVTYQYGGAGNDPEAVAALNHTSGGTFRSYSYDLAGNMTTRAVVPLWTEDTFVYDGEDQLRRATPKVNNVTQPREEYFYDESGARFGILSRSSTGSITGLRVFMGDTEIKFSSAGALLKSYAHISLGTPIARVVDRGNLELQFHGLANNTLLSASWTGATQSAFVYGPYGELLETTGTAQPEQHRRFNDKYKDDVTKLSYYGARYYDGLLLGWTQADPAYRFLPDMAGGAPRRAVLYQFSLNNPLRYIDPDGRDSRAIAAENRMGYGCFGSPCGAQRQRSRDSAEYQRAYGSGLRGIQVGVDVASIADQTPALNLVSAALSAADGDWVGVSLGLIAAALTPTVIGDEVVEVGKVGRSVERLNGADSGVIYLRTNAKTGEEYVGQAKNSGRFQARQKEHRDAHPGETFQYDVLEEIPAGSGRSLDVAEEDWIRAGGGPAVKGGRLANDRYQMSDKAYAAAGGTVPKPTK